MSSLLGRDLGGEEDRDLDLVRPVAAEQRHLLAGQQRDPEQGQADGDDDDHGDGQQQVAAESLVGLDGDVRQPKRQGRTPRSWSRTTLPCSSSTTRLRIWSTMRSSWVAMTTVVPVRLIRSSSRMMSCEVVGSEVPRRLVAEHQQGRLTNARAIETRCCSPPDSSGEAVGLVLEADQLQHLGDGPLDRVPPGPDDLEGEGDVLAHGLVGQQLEVLEHAADGAAQGRHLPGGEPVELLAGDPDLARGGPLLLGQQAQEGRLAGAGLADHEDELAFADLHGHVVEGGDVVPIGLADMVELDHGAGMAFRSSGLHGREVGGLPGGRRPGQRKTIPDLPAEIRELCGVWTARSRPPSGPAGPRPGRPWALPARSTGVSR